MAFSQGALGGNGVFCCAALLTSRDLIHPTIKQIPAMPMAASTPLAKASDINPAT